MTTHPPSTGLTYRDAGVDIAAGDALVTRIRPFAARTRRPGVLAGLGGFGALFELPIDRFRHPVLVAGTDGVGTKLRLAWQWQQHATIGVDLVAMCVNDIIVQGAEPLFFLDYYATGHLDVDQAATVIQGIALGCEQAGCALVGGETAEMPGMYAGSEYDLAGFAVGIVEKDRIIDGSAIRAGDLLLGVASSGPHSNGYSLIRRILEGREDALSAPVPGDPTGTLLRQALLAPTQIYVTGLLGLLRTGLLHGLAHITGGGITENLPRILPQGLDAEIHLDAWQRPPVFRWLQEQGKVSETEMLRTFNCGIGMILALSAEHLDATVTELRAYGLAAVPIGRVIPGSGTPRVRYPALEPCA
jgi:phosphoribosylformylglycinamidine cyclo-ligase